MTAGAAAGGKAAKGGVELAPAKGAAALPAKAPPLAPPPFTKGELEAAIPKHCFERDALRSLSHVAIDLVIVAAFGYAASWISHAAVPMWARALLWPLYWYAQGAICTGLWVIAHECGHQAFSPSKTLNDSVGWVLHSALLVPYHSWRISHKNHHSYTCSMENDEVFVPATRSMVADMISESPIASAWGIFVMLTFGWPGYLAANFSGPAKYRGKNNSHYSLTSSLFDEQDTDADRLASALDEREKMGPGWAPVLGLLRLILKAWVLFERAAAVILSPLPGPIRKRWDILVSDVGLFAALGAIGYASYLYGAANVLFYYGIPYLVVNAHLVLITYLQHTDVYVPHFRESEFTWLRGALSTVDRSFGWLLDSAFHHIADTHVAHHLFHTMPWYHAQEATEALKKKLGPYYLSDSTPILPALWRSWKACKYVDEDGGIVFYKGPKQLREEAAGKAGKKAL